jgi:quercetin dioxygenase-like cupin family protein
MSTQGGASLRTVAPVEGERLNVVGDAVRVLADASVSGGRCSIFEITTQPGAGPPLHRHGVDDEYFYIIEGRYTFVGDGVRREAGPGTFIRAARGSVHTYVNAGDAPGRMLVITSPSGLEEPFRETHRRTAAGETLNPDSLTAIFAAFNLTIHGPPLTSGSGTHA